MRLITRLRTEWQTLDEATSERRFTADQGEG
jgi:hypothetical protein